MMSIHIKQVLPAKSEEKAAQFGNTVSAPSLQVSRCPLEYTIAAEERGRMKHFHMMSHMMSVIWSVCFIAELNNNCLTFISDTFIEFSDRGPQRSGSPDVCLCLMVCPPLLVSLRVTDRCSRDVGWIESRLTAGIWLRSVKKSHNYCGPVSDTWILSSDQSFWN